MEKWQENRNYRKIRDENGTVIANIITDILNAVVDPRIKLDS